ncbi:hypothetical protein AB0F11_30410 [Streptomyces sp. NPDC032472]|uniref:hypothetical protein n=1 Tax=Streptomyces sp. NPDC032472 TaxID=3155018 RepID=UPI0033DC68EC
MNELGSFHHYADTGGHVDERRRGDGAAPDGVRHRGRRSADRQWREGARSGADDQLVSELRLDSSRQLIVAQCSGALVLAHLGFLNGMPACTAVLDEPFHTRQSQRSVRLR